MANETFRFFSGGLFRTSLIHTPTGWNGKTPVPLMISYHGRGGDGTDQQKLTHFDDVADREKFIVVYPYGIGGTWNALNGAGEAEERDVDDVAFTKALINRLLLKYPIDQKKIYASGMSNGGYLAHRLGRELSDKFAAIASVAGPMAPLVAEGTPPPTPPAVIYFHGTLDPYVPYEGGVTTGDANALSAEATVDKWKEWNQATGEVQLSTIGQVQITTYSGIKPIRFCKVNGGGHTWPGGFQYLPKFLIGETNRDVDASEMIWQFCLANPKP